MQRKNAASSVFERSSPPRRPGTERTTLAVALRHDPQSAAEPRITASGRGKVADQILCIAFDHGVKVRTDADLAQILATLEVDSLIPVEAFAAVAEILAYVYRANRQAPPTIEEIAP